MKKFLLTLILCLTSIVSFAASGHFYFKVGQNGEVSPTGNYTEHAGISATINSLVKSESGYYSIDVTIHHNHHHENPMFDVYRLHADATTHRPTDENNTDWDMKAEAISNSEWCCYEQVNGNDPYIHFVDTFKASLLTNELSTVNTIKYEFVDHQNGHTYIIQINDAFYGNIMTSITEVTNDSQIIYYDLQGHSSNKSFKGLNIVKNGNKTYKVIF